MSKDIQHFSTHNYRLKQSRFNHKSGVKHNNIDIYSIYSDMHHQVLYPRFASTIHSISNDNISFISYYFNKPIRRDTILEYVNHEYTYAAKAANKKRNRSAIDNKEDAKYMKPISDKIFDILKSKTKDFIINEFEDKLSTVLVLDYNPVRMQLAVYKYIKRHCKRYKNYFYALPYKFNKYEVKTLNFNKDLLFSMDQCTICNVSKSKSTTISDDCIYVSIKFIGANHRKWAKDFMSFNKRVNKLIDKSSSIQTYSVSSFGNNTDVVNSDLDPKPISTVYTNDGEISNVIQHINKWKEKCQLYASKGITYKTGILLYGKPGTGKSSIISALASYYNANIVYIDISKLKDINLSMLSPVLTNTAKHRFIFVVMEEIDVIFSKERDGDDNETNANIRQLLQFLDSAQSPSNVVFIATTNYIDRLDPALIRKGRFDLKIELGDFNKDTAKKMCDGFKLSEDKTKNLLNSIEYPINPAELQSKILEVL